MKVYEKLKLLNINITALCRSIGIGVPSFYRYVNGDREWPLKAALKICNLYPQIEIHDFTSTKTVPRKSDK
jgi:hypothetical protein